MAVFEVPQITSATAASASSRMLRHESTMSCSSSSSSSMGASCEYPSSVVYLLASAFFLGVGVFMLLSALGVLGDSLHAYLEVCWYLGMVFVLCGVVTGVQCYFYLREKLVCSSFDGQGATAPVHQRRNRRPRSGRRLWLQTNRSSNRRGNQDMLPQWVTQLIHDQLQHLGPGEELLINLPLNGASNPPPYEVVVVQGSRDAPPPTYVEAIALLNHHQQQQQQQPASQDAAEKPSCCSAASPPAVVMAAATDEIAVVASVEKP
ncbi:uncharacterized protein LOC106646035 [Copidosoma floridanum]|uniref:uncharacterized protein LOC106646035 n=1 Tax=Copidosoma floridanum TaxID=29053 RepID=UPI0006C9792E|nr:uncharacterized protein LOC106646035 [Copidosoma floridanum]XP_014217522.1 uncharacterized protein LOC106646035 [Copidosoma floridanum]XP_014217523.1 uncharacterized protein LOC106646035 [Copidosoma floridanum]